MGRYARVSWRRMVCEWEGTLELAGGEWSVSGKVELAHLMVTLREVDGLL